jgi:hypothetical protein
MDKSKEIVRLLNFDGDSHILIYPELAGEDGYIKIHKSGKIQFCLGGFSPFIRVEPSEEQLDKLYNFLKCKMNTKAYNAGYHKGGRSEYHGENINEMYEKWLKSELISETHLNMMISFVGGYIDGMRDYLESLHS